MARPKKAQPPEGRPPITASELTIVEEVDPILDASFILGGAKLLHRGKQTPLDVLLAEQQVPVNEDMMNHSRDAVRALVERGLVSHILLNWVREFQLASNESQQWVNWIGKMMGEGKHLRASMMVRFGEYRRGLVKSQRELGLEIMKEVRNSATDKKSRELVRSYLPRAAKPNPIAEAIANGQNPLVEGKEPTSAELATAFDPRESDPEVNFSAEGAPA